MKYISNSSDLSIFLDAEIKKKVPIKNISTDTRKIKKDSLFIAIKGKKFNGNDFVKEAFNKGSSIALVDDKKFKLVTDKKII